MVWFGRWLKLMALSYAKVVRPGKKGRHSTRYLQGYIYLGEVGRPAICVNIYIYLSKGRPTRYLRGCIYLGMGRPTRYLQGYIHLGKGWLTRGDIYMGNIGMDIYIWVRVVRPTI